MRHLTLDFETYYNSKDGYTLSKISMAEYVRDPRFKVFGLGVKELNSDNRFWLSGEQEIREWVKMVNWSDTAVIVQNAKFDGAILEWIFNIKPQQYIDTLAMSRAVLGRRLQKHSLANIANYFGFAPKGDLRTDGLLTLTAEEEKALAEYCLHDCDLAEAIYKKLAQFFPLSEYGSMDWTIKAFTRPLLVLNQDKLASIAATERERRTTIFTRLGIEKKVFSSNEKFSALLRAEGYSVPMKLSPKQKNDDGSPKEIPALALGDVAFLEMCDSEDTRLADLCEARVAAKSALLETRSEKLLKVARTGAFPFDVSYSGAQQTHRYSGAKGAGGNPQNFPQGDGLRDCVEAPEGYKLIVSDFGAIEARIVAFAARETKLTSVFATVGGDPYCDFASQIYGRTITKADKTERKLGKEGILGLGYGMGWKKFSKRIKIKLSKDLTEEEAKKIIYAYREYYNRVPALWEELESYFPLLASRGHGWLKCMPFIKIDDGCLVLPSGLRIQYPNLEYTGPGKEEGWKYTIYTSKSKKAEVTKLYGGKCLENISQAVAGDLCKMAIRRAEKPWLPVKGQVHDELIAVAPDEAVDEAKEIIERAMTMPPSYWPELRLTCEVGVGQSWFKAKDKV